jgi:hypothetical protein
VASSTFSGFRYWYRLPSDAFSYREVAHSRIRRVRAAGRQGYLQLLSLSVSVSPFCRETDLNSDEEADAVM